MTTTLRSLNLRPRLTTALQIGLLLAVFQGVVATTPSLPSAHADSQKPSGYGVILPANARA